MTVTELSIQSLAPPLLIISACGLVGLAQFTRYTAIAGRIRGLHRERFELLEKLLHVSGEEKQIVAARCEMLSRQSQGLLGHARLTRNALLFIVGSVICMVASSLLIGVESLMPILCEVGAFASFVLGLSSLLIGMLFVFAEVMRSLSLVIDEHNELEHELPDQAGPGGG